jgi:putative ABC transport system permease protein
MSAVWVAARGAVRRRRVQTVVIGLVVFMSAVTVVVALSLLAASANPFGRAFAGQDGAHLVAAFDRARVPDARLEQTARRPGVTAAAGPFAEAVVNVTKVTGQRSKGLGAIPPSPVMTGPLTVVGRAGPGGPVDHLNLWLGHWVAGPEQIVLDLAPTNLGPEFLGSSVRFSGGQALTSSASPTA